MKKTSSAVTYSLIAFIVVFVVTVDGLKIDHGDGARFRVCNGSIAECEAEQELLLDSEEHRRVLAEGSMIGYGAVTDKDRPVCQPGGGRPYANCLPHPNNAYHRGCSAYDRCRITG